MPIQAGIEYGEPVQSPHDDVERPAASIMIFRSAVLEAVGEPGEVF